MIRVLVSAPSPLLRAGLETVIRGAEGLSLAATSGEADVVLAFADPQSRDDLHLETGPAFVLLADNPQPAWIGEALRAGARAVLPGDSAPAEIAAAVEAAAAGLFVLHPHDVPALIVAPVAERAGEAPGQSLTPREIEVLRLMADGEPNKGIAWRLGISEHTVKFHVASVMAKLNAASRTEAVTLGMRRGLILL